MYFLSIDLQNPLLLELKKTIEIMNLHLNKFIFLSFSGRIEKSCIKNNLQKGVAFSWPWFQRRNFQSDHNRQGFLFIFFFSIYFILFTLFSFPTFLHHWSLRRRWNLLYRAVSKWNRLSALDCWVEVDECDVLCVHWI